MSSSSEQQLSPSLQSLVKTVKNGNNELKFIFVGGKGGVGKTTSSSAIGTLLATVCDKRVLLISTDPAHSLGDAWRTSFSNEPTSPMKNLHVMEVDPKDTLEKELETWSDHVRELNLGGGGSPDKEEEDNPLGNAEKFREWLSGIPGIDEAIALSSAMSHIESGDYDLIVFDTAPTGHTLKLLALPPLLEKGISQLQSWSTTLWGYFDAIKGGNTNTVKNEVAAKLADYKKGISKVAGMLRDQTRTRFVVVCIAEFLSVSETKRLLEELNKNRIRASHVIVNQLVVDDALSKDELQSLESMAEVGDLGSVDPALLKKTIHACRLTTARKEIQERYLTELLNHGKSLGGTLEGICRVPLLPMEVTGNDAILRFSKILAKGIDDDETNSLVDSSAGAIVPSVGDVVRIMQLEKSPHLNGFEGTVITKIDGVTGRIGVSLRDPDNRNKKKKLALLPKNLAIVRRSGGGDGQKKKNAEKKKKQDKNKQEDDGSKEASNNDDAVNSVMEKAKGILDDPEIKEMIAKEPKVKVAIEDCLQNPMNFVKYISDPDLTPYTSKIMSKLRK